jgi:DNA helicase-2/ATP-dependent DNA helicase PcrA
MKITSSQRRAVEHTGRNLQLIACAGSGKTEVVAQRVVYLLTPGRADSLSLRNIIAFPLTCNHGRFAPNSSHTASP